MQVPIMVVGGGIGGLSAAIALAAEGLRVTVVERSAEFAEIGAGIQLGANATRILHRFGVLDEVAATAVEPARARMCDLGTGQTLTRLRFGAPYRARYGAPYLVVHRGDLLTALHDRCRADPLIEIWSGRKVTRVLPRQDTVVVAFEDGERYDCAAVVGADGASSRTRALVGDYPLRRTGFTTYRGIAPVERLSDPVPAEVHIWISPNAHLVRYPVRSGRLCNVAAVVRDRPDGTAADLDERFAPACAQAKAALALIDRSRCWPVCDLPPLPTWRSGTVTLLGDAAHPMVQYLAQAACQALEDAVSLGTALATEPDTVRALDRYERDRIPRTGRCQTAATAWGEVWHTADPITRGLRDRLFQARDETDYSEVDWLYRSATETSVAATPSSARDTVYS
ncbi:FAD-dependent monooxygenase [Solwaraspora sp. WMMB335]|uniref:FAD-dependent monooxygenase n=1 Tax=Solwaraspora sp. WMMB335 TaxID=3404118 RepID=UPI003B9443DC